MGRIDIILSDNLDNEFRMEVARMLGMKKGNLTIAIEEAIREWIESRRKRRSKIAEKAWETRKMGHKAVRRKE